MAELLPSVTHWATKLMADTATVSLDASGKEKFSVTLTSQAFGQLVFGCNMWVGNRRSFMVPKHPADSAVSAAKVNLQEGPMHPQVTASLV